MKLQFVENLLDEARFKNPSQLDSHYEEHVRKDGEEFDHGDPKFNADISKEEYAKKAEELSLVDAKTAETFDELSAAAYRANPKELSIKVDSPSYRSPRVIKYRFGPGRYMEKVIYAEDDSDGEIISYMLARKGRIQRDWRDRISDDEYEKHFGREKQEAPEEEATSEPEQQVEVDDAAEQEQEVDE